jgi:ADP-heptose:LPS heptosyltransferase
MRRILLWFFGAPVEKRGWENRVLLVNLEGLGDLVMMTSVLKHYKTFLPGKRLTLVTTTAAGLGVEDLAPWVDEVVKLNYQAFVKKPWYGLQFVNRLRRVGFHTVVSHDPSAAEVMGKMLCFEVGGAQCIGYEGFGLQLTLPLDRNMERNIHYVHTRVFPHYATVIPSVDNHMDYSRRIPNFLRAYAALFETITGSLPPDVIPALRVHPAADARVRELLTKHGLRPGSYAVLTLGTTTPHREWPAERFAEAAEILRRANIPVVLMGAPREAALGARFLVAYKDRVVNLIGKTSVREAIALIGYSLLSFSNDTASVHIAVALRKPSLAILGLGHFGMVSLYGYADINKWIWSNSPCLCDDWRCIHTVGPQDPALCVAAVKVEDVSRALSSLVEQLKQGGAFPKTSFQVEFENP